AICSAGAARAEAVAGRFGVPRATDDYRDLIGPGIDAVVIATPPAQHARMGLDAIAAGKHVLCEKPLAASLAEARALRDGARAAGVVHVVNYADGGLATIRGVPVAYHGGGFALELNGTGGT